MPEAIYPDMDEFYRDLTELPQGGRGFPDAGCRPIQLDEVNSPISATRAPRQQVTEAAATIRTSFRTSMRR